MKYFFLVLAIVGICGTLFSQEIKLKTTKTLDIDKNKTALVVIDLQKGIASLPVKPYSTSEIISNAVQLVNVFRRNNMPVFLVHVQVSKETMLRVLSDVTFSMPGALSQDWAEFVPGLAPAPSDVVITKRQWGAFYGTELDLQLRRRGIDTIVLCGIATDYGVESTARFAYEYGYQQIFVENAMGSLTEEQHNAAINFIFKRMGRVRKTSEIVEALLKTS